MECSSSACDPLEPFMQNACVRIRYDVDPEYSTWLIHVSTKAMNHRISFSSFLPCFTMTATESSLQKAAKQCSNLETSFSGIDLSEFAPSQNEAPTSHANYLLRERLARDAQRRRIQDQEELKLAAAIQSARKKNKPAPRPSSLADVLVGMHEMEQRQESRMKLKKKTKSHKQSMERQSSKKQVSPKKKRKSPAKY